jgi:hypothetical protein
VNATRFTYTIPTATLTGHGGGGFIQPSPVLLSKIINYTDSMHVTLNDAAPVTVTNTQIAFGADDTQAIQNVIDNTLCPSTTDGCTVLLPNGHYWIQHLAGQTYALTLTAGSHALYRFAGTGNASDKAITGGNTVLNQSNATSELVSADPITPIFTIGTTTSPAMNDGPRFERLGFRDVSGVCASPGGILFQNVARSRLEDVSFREFCNGYAVKYDALVTGVNQFNYVENITAIDVQNGIVFADGTNFDNWVEFGTFYHSQTGGGVCIDFQGNQGGNAGGTNFVMSGSCNFFPIAVHLVDQHSDFISTKAENTSMIGNNVVGGASSSAQSGVGIQIDGTANSTCFQNRLISPVLGFFDTPIVVGTNCTNNMVVGASYAPSSTLSPVSDGGTGNIIWDQFGLHFGAKAHMHASGVDVGGFQTTSAGGTYTVGFGTPYVNTPYCVATPLSSATIWLTSLSPSGFVVNTTPGNVGFNYLCVGNGQ